MSAVWLLGNLIANNSPGNEETERSVIKSENLVVESPGSSETTSENIQTLGSLSKSEHEALSAGATTENVESVSPVSTTKQNTSLNIKLHPKIVESSQGNKAVGEKSNSILSPERSKGAPGIQQEVSIDASNIITVIVSDSDKNASVAVTMDLDEEENKDSTSRVIKSADKTGMYKIYSLKALLKKRITL